MKVVFSILIILLINNLNIYSQNYNTSVSELMGLSSRTVQNTKFNLLPTVSIAFNKMKKDAEKEGIFIQIVSGFRSYERQQYIFNKKYIRYKNQGLSKNNILKKIIEYSTIPGTSRHHWGTDIDIVQNISNMPKNLLIQKNYESDGPFCPMKQWMDENAYKYGFYLVYTKNKNRTGFNYEPWHYSYAPISKIFLKQLVTENKKDEIFSTIKKTNPNIDKQFYINYFETHVLGINPLLILSE